MAIKYTVMDFKDVKNFENFSTKVNGSLYTFIKLPIYNWFTERGEYRDKKLFNACETNNPYGYRKDGYNNGYYRYIEDDTECIVYGER